MPVALAPQPKWYFVANNGDPLGAGRMYTYRSLNKTQAKFVYQDINGSIPYPNPVLIDANGTAGPIYWDTNPDDPYYIRVYDSNNNFLYDIDDFLPTSDGGGGGGTTYVSLENLVVNGSFWRNIGTSATPVPASLTLAPSSHSAFSSPDITFFKNTTVNTDTISFVQFTDGDVPLTGDVTPLFYMHYSCITSLGGETAKYVQFPIIPKVKNLEQQEVTVTFWARCTAGANTLVVYPNQFFGDGTNSPSADVGILLAQTVTLTSSWEPQQLTFTLPSIGLKTIGNCHNDAVYLRFQYPLSMASTIDLALPSFYVGDIDPDTDFETYDQVDSVTDSPRCGDIRTSLNAFQPFGWVQANDRTIGTPSSNATSRANTDTFFLYKLIWDTVSNTFAPIYDSAGVATTRGASAVADFAGNKQLQLTRALGRVLAGMNSDTVSSQTFTANTVLDTINVASNLTYPLGCPIYFTSTGSVPNPFQINTVYYAMPVAGSTTAFRVALSADLAQAGTNVDIVTAGTGTMTVHSAIGVYNGEGVHTIAEFELPNHAHPIPTYNPSGSFTSAHVSAGQIPEPSIGNATTLNNVSPNTPMNNMQPTAFYNMFFKL